MPLTSGLYETLSVMIGYQDIGALMNIRRSNDYSKQGDYTD